MAAVPDNGPSVKYSAYRGREFVEQIGLRSGSERGTGHSHLAVWSKPGPVVRDQTMRMVFLRAGGKQMALHLPRSIVFACVAIVAAALPLSAQPIAIVNPSFEDPVLPDAGFVFAVPGWTFSNTGTGTLNPTTASYPAQAPDGQNVAFINQGTGSPSPDTLAQVLGTTLQANTVYTLQVEVGHRLDLPPGPYDVQLLAGGVILGSDNSVVPAPGTFRTVTVRVATDASPPQLGLPLEVRLVSPAKESVQVNFDNVRLFAERRLPAPAATTLGLVGMIALMLIGGVFKLRSRGIVAITQIRRLTS
jgi:hypothetical protein